MAKIKGPFLVIGQVVNLLICDPNEEIISKPVKSLSVDIHSGIEDDKHKERVSDTREEEMANFGLPKGTKIANDRQFSAISTEQMEEIKTLWDYLRPYQMGYLVRISLSAAYQTLVCYQLVQNYFSKMLT